VKSALSISSSLFLSFAVRLPHLRLVRLVPDLLEVPLEFKSSLGQECAIIYTVLFGKPLIYSGDGYFRLFPYFCIKHWARQTSYLMTYFHPRDFDAGQPKIADLSLTCTFKSYVGLGSAFCKFQRLLHDFADIATADILIDWEKARTITV
jgi:hypothetical protein